MDKDSELQRNVDSLFEFELLKDMHAAQWDAVYSFLYDRSRDRSTKTEPSIVIAMPRPFIAPYALHHKELDGLLGEGNIAFLLSKHTFDTEDERLRRFFKDSLPFVEEYVFCKQMSEFSKCLSSESGVEEPSKKNVTINLKNGKNDVHIKPFDPHRNLIFSNSCVSVFDATCVIENVAKYTDQLDYFLSEVYRVLEPRGLLHIGTANVDTSLQSEKIWKIVKATGDCLKSNVYIEDKRHPVSGSDDISERILHRYRTIGPATMFLKDEEELLSTHFKTGKEDPYVIMRITKRGRIHIQVYTKQQKETLFGHLQSEGYHQLEFDGYASEIDPRTKKKIPMFALSMPIIDHSISYDADKFILPLTSYYHRRLAEIEPMLNAVSPKDRHIIIQAMKQVEQEGVEAKLGASHFYISPRSLVTMLSEHKFVDIEPISFDPADLYCSITARKP